MLKAYNHSYNSVKNYSTFIVTMEKSMTLFCFLARNDILNKTLLNKQIFTT